jgi:hypothetical protein
MKNIINNTLNSNSDRKTDAESKLNSFLDKLVKIEKRPFSARFGPFKLYEMKYVTPSADDFQFNIKMERVDFSNDSFKDSFKDEDSSYCSAYEKDLVTSDNYLRYPAGKNFPCHFKNCKKVYTSSYGLKYHVDHGHTTEKNNERRPYMCEVDNCGKTYKNNNGLKYHIIHTHKEYASTKPDFFL